MKYKIIVDSSSNLKSDYLINEKDIGFDVVPLTIRINDKEYVDDDNIDVNEMLNDYELTKKGQTSCPSPNDFLSKINGADYYFIFTISSKLSGAYASALIAKDISELNDKVFLLDSKLVCGSIEELVIKTVELIKENKDIEEIKKELTSFRDSMNLLFILDRFDNLVENGRINKVVAFVAKLANIKPLCYGEDGEIKIKEKIRTFLGAIKRLSYNVGKMASDFNRPLIISHTNNLEMANELKVMIENEYNFKNVIIREHKGLSAFYSQNGGIIVCF